MDFIVSISRPGKSWNSSEGHGKSMKSNMLNQKKGKLKDKKLKKQPSCQNWAFINFSENRHEHTFCAL